MSMKQLLREFEHQSPEIVFEWNDPESEARGWVVINSLRNGAAGGGTRMRKGLDRREVESLAKTMEIKFTVSGPPIGGAKSGIDFDPHDPRKPDVLKRWYQAVIPLLKNYYGTGGDLYVDEINEVIPITESFGLWHPQEGIVNGYYEAEDPQKIKKIGQLRQGVTKVIENSRISPSTGRKYTVADLVTGWGVSESVRHFYSLWNDNLAGKRVIVQGWGNVGAAAGYYLAKSNAKVVGIIDKGGGLMKPEGFSVNEISALYLNRKGTTLNAPDLLTFDEVNEKIWDMGAEVMIPAAASRLVSQQQTERMIKAGLEVISAGANVPFDDAEIFFGPATEYADQNLALIPDFIANCGMARVFAYLMESNVSVTDEAIFNDVSKIIHDALARVRNVHSERTNLAAACYEVSLAELLGKGEPVKA